MSVAGESTLQELSMFSVMFSGSGTPNFLRTCTLITMLCLLAPARLRAAEAADQGPPPTPRAKAAQALRGLPLAFEPNVGQASAGVDYVARSAGYSLSLSSAGVALQLDVPRRRLWPRR
jgi:hypothetical protein